MIAQDVQAENGGSINHSLDQDNSGSGSGSIRPNALHEANIFHSSFFGGPLPLAAAAAAAAAAANDNIHSSSSSSPSSNRKPKNERLCLGGHRETIFGLSFSPDGVYFATASQDSTIGIWSTKSHRLVMTLKEGMDVKFECLRVAWSMGRGSNGSAGMNEKYLLASAGADGIARLWSANIPATADANDNNDGELQWRCVGMLDHYLFEKEDRNCSHAQKEEEDGDEREEDDESDRPQIYALQFIPGKERSGSSTNALRLVTSTNDCIYLWDIHAKDDGVGGDDGINLRKFNLHTSIQFTHLNDDTNYNINTFGGERNPDNALYVFDASYCNANDWIGVALSDGTCRVLSPCNATDAFDDNGVDKGSSSYQERCVLGLPPGYFGNNQGGGHLTALSWDASGTRLATSLASGRVVLWSIHAVKNGMDGDVLLQPSCMSILEGGEYIVSTRVLCT
jgi:WD40 repeat protein